MVKGLLDKHRSAAPPPQQPPAKAKQSPSSSEGAAAKEKEKEKPEKPEKSAPPSSGKKATSKPAKGKVCEFSSNQCVYVTLQCRQVQLFAGKQYHLPSSFSSSSVCYFLSLPLTLVSAGPLLSSPIPLSLTASLLLPPSLSPVWSSEGRCLSC